MQVMAFSNFRKNATRMMNMVTDENELLVVTRQNNKSMILMPLDQYNELTGDLHAKAILETLAKRSLALFKE